MWNLQNFDFAPIFYEIHHMCCWMSLTASHILESYRMGIFIPYSFPFFDFLHCFLGVFCSFYKITSIWICHVVGFISLAINMLVGWDICHLKGGIHKLRREYKIISVRYQEAEIYAKQNGICGIFKLMQCCKSCKRPLITVQKINKRKTIWKKNSQPITSQYMGSG